MGLKIKNFQEILRDMVDYVSVNTNKLVDFSVGSAIRTLLEAVSTEIDQFYYKMYNNMKWAVENAIFKSFDFERRPAIEAYGDLTITFSNPIPEDITIPKGTKFATNNADRENTLYYETETDYQVTEGSVQAIIEVHCTTPGEIGNVVSGTITLMTNAVEFVSTVTNEEPFTTGKEAETLSERKQRFAKYVNTRARATESALEYGAKTVEGIVGVYVDDSQVPVSIYVHDQDGELSDELRLEVSQVLENYRAAGIPILVSPIIKQEIDVEGTIYVLSQFNTPEFKTLVEEKVYGYMNSFVASEDLQTSDLNLFVRNIDETAIDNFELITPESDIIIGSAELVRPGNINITLVSI